MRYGIFADVHSNLQALDAVLDAYRKEKIDQYLCVGDVVGYGANPKECIEKIRALETVIVAGNHDWVSVDLLSADYFNTYAKEAVLWTKRKLGDGDRIFLESLKLVYKNQDLTLVHGTLHVPENFDYMVDAYSASMTFGLLETSICFVGHSHIAGIFIKDKDGNISYNEDSMLDLKRHNKYIINAGSVGQPRDNNPDACYCIFDTDNKEVQIKRISYDVHTAKKRIIAEGLPRFLGDRLIVGR